MDLFLALEPFVGCGSLRTGSKHNAQPVAIVQASMVFIEKFIHTRPAWRSCELLVAVLFRECD
jgi:hypothetical protein